MAAAIAIMAITILGNWGGGSDSQNEGGATQTKSWYTKPNTKDGGYTGKEKETGRPYDEELEGLDGDAVTRDLEFARSITLALFENVATVI